MSAIEFEQFDHSEMKSFMQVDPDSQKLKEEDHRNQIAHHPSALSSILILGSI
jgi:hypothetical protein